MRRFTISPLSIAHGYHRRVPASSTVTSPPLPPSAPANDDIIQRKAGVWTNRTMAQLLVDVGRAAARRGPDRRLPRAEWRRPGRRYTPTITASSGTFTTVSATGRYLIIGKLMLVEMKISITTIGHCCAALLIATLPTSDVGIPVRVQRL